MADLIEAFLKLSQHDPLFVAVLILLLVALLAAACIPSVFAFFVVRDFKSVGFQLISKIDELVNKVGGVEDEIRFMRESFTTYKAVVDTKLEALEARLSGRR